MARDLTSAWDDLRIYPALGNHEFAACLQAVCLERWWTAYPELRDRRWYSVALGSRVLAVALDSTASLLPGSEQQAWLEREIAALDVRVRVVLIVIHHPPLADVQTVKLVDHNPRPNERALAAYLEGLAAHSAARFVVTAQSRPAPSSRPRPTLKSSSSSSPIRRPAPWSTPSPTLSRKSKALSPSS